MKLMIYILLFITLLGCKENQKAEKYDSQTTNASTYTKPKESEISAPKTIEEKIVWDTKKAGNFTFSLPSNFNLESNLSSYNKKVYIADNETLGLTVDIANLPSGYENSTIAGMIPNLNDFGSSINQDNRKYFDDFKLINTKYSYLGNVESVEVSQSSTKVSGKNKLMSVKAYFVISNPYYCSITFSYPKNSYQGEQTIERIKNSFKFESQKNNSQSNITNNSAQNTNQPSLKESQEWILSKLKKYLIQETDYSDGTYGPINKYITTFTNVRIDNNNLIFTYNFKVYEPYVDERTQRNYDNAGISRDMALRMSKDKKLTRDENRTITIPLKSISDTYYDKNKNYSGECDFSISTKNNDITERNLTKGTTNYKSYFSFTYDCSQEDDLGNRINKALQHIISLTPNSNRQNNEPF